jgi:alkylated DNA repair dioxygenase AlkB
MKIRSTLSKNKSKKMNTQTVSLMDSPIYQRDFVTSDEEKKLLDIFSSINEWNTKLKRNTLHYGFEYDYTKKNTLHLAAKIPDWLEPIRLRVSSSFGKDFDQVLVNKYLPGEGFNCCTYSINNKEQFIFLIVT